jgi:hypothetical protein
VNDERHRSQIGAERQQRTTEDYVEIYRPRGLADVDAFDLVSRSSMMADHTAVELPPMRRTLSLPFFNALTAFASPARVGLSCSAADPRCRADDRQRAHRPRPAQRRHDQLSHPTHRPSVSFQTSSKTDSGREMTGSSCRAVGLSEATRVNRAEDQRHRFEQPKS